MWHGIDGADLRDDVKPMSMADAADLLGIDWTVQPLRVAVQTVSATPSGIVRGEAEVMELDEIMAAALGQADDVLPVAGEVPTSGEISRKGGAICGRGMSAGRGNWFVVDDGDAGPAVVTIDIDDERNDEVWMHLHLTREQLQAMLDAMPST